MNSEERQEFAKRILSDLYRNAYIETLYNTEEEKFQREGWTLVSGQWSPWYFNLRPVGASPRIVSDIAYAMNHLVRDKVPGLAQIVGIEMAGVPLVSAIGLSSGPGCELIPYAYTRPLEAKIRSAEGVKEKLAKFKFDYGHKSLVEGRFEDGDVLCIVDDMVTNFGSKLITRAILEYEMEIRGIKNVGINHVAVVLDREQGGAEEAAKNGMQLHPLIKFKTDGLGWLKDIMLPEEHALISDYQQDPKKYQNKELREKVLAEVAKIRGK